MQDVSKRQTIKTIYCSNLNLHGVDYQFMQKITLFKMLQHPKGEHAILCFTKIFESWGIVDLYVDKNVLTYFAVDNLQFVDGAWFSMA